MICRYLVRFGDNPYSATTLRQVVHKEVLCLTGVVEVCLQDFCHPASLVVFLLFLSLHYFRTSGFRRLGTCGLSFGLRLLRFGLYVRAV